eukprot:TRINITY_DN21689_c0_g1_i1.p1 TRINITY_DN21689_c0_g1~~TRINITY_DN21689_c0_g1_i1.p1  ORF type:complete len:322 (-),score=76.26 TRINITY_DN21689_c0_g1_i1:60-968(-)
MCIRDSTKEVYCDVCFKHLNLKDQLSKEDGAFMMFCRKCNLAVHHCCYGLKTDCTIEETEYGEQVPMFLCDQCSLAESDDSKSNAHSCVVCSNSSGALKRMRDDSWVHVLCALTCDLITVEDFATMSFDCSALRDEQLPAKLKKSLKCQYCNNKKYTIKCEHADCEHHAHAYCALRSKAEFLRQNGVDYTVNGWNIRHCVQKNEHANFALSEDDENLEEMLKQLYIQYESLPKKSKDIGTLVQSSLRNEEEEEKAPKEKGKGRGSKKGQKKQPLLIPFQDIRNLVYEEVRKRALVVLSLIHI